MTKETEDILAMNVSVTKHYWETHGTCGFQKERIFTTMSLFVKIEAVAVFPIILTDGEWAAINP